MKNRVHPYIRGYKTLPVSRLEILIDSLCIAAVAVLSFYLSSKAGELGFFAFDQSVCFDGAWRIISGQVPYKDFVFPMGLPAFLIQAAFFKLIGVNYSAYITAAAFMNAAASLCAIAVVRASFPHTLSLRKILSYLGGLITAFWFYPPFGTTSDVQTSFLFSFAALALFLRTVNTDEFPSSVRALFLFSTGALSFLSFLSKQSAGILILPLFPVLAAASGFPDIKKTARRSFLFLSGLLGGIVLFISWLWAFSDLGAFFRHSIQMPFDLVGYRLSANWAEAAADPLMRTLPPPVNVILLLALAVAVISLGKYVLDLTKKEKTSKAQLVSSTLCIYLVGFQYAFIRLTQNQAENGIPFTGVISALMAAIIFTYLSRMRIFKLLIMLFSAYLMFEGYHVSMTRRVHDIFDEEKTVFPLYLKEKGFDGLRWAMPTKLEGVEIRRDGVKGVIEYLRAEDKNFFIFPDFTVFYGALGKPSPQRLLWFQKGVTYPFSYDGQLDMRIVEDLEKNNVEIVVLEDVSYLNTLLRMDDFPKLRAYITKNFSPVGQIGIFLISRRNYP